MKKTCENLLVDRKARLEKERDEEVRDGLSFLVFPTVRNFLGRAANRGKLFVGRKAI